MKLFFNKNKINSKESKMILKLLSNNFQKEIVLIMEAFIMNNLILT
jgi:hypothetical protein